MNFRTLISVIVSIITTLMLCMAAPTAAADEPVMSASQMTEFLVNSRSAKNATDLKVIGKPPSVTILGQIGSKATEKDLKIDAIFCAKTLIHESKGRIERVKVLFTQTGREGRCVSVDKTIIDGYESGKLNADQLLASVHLVPVEGEQAAPNVVAGPHFERRLLIWQRIEKLRKQGTGVKPFEVLFASVEEMSKGTESKELVDKISFLEIKLQDQEERIKQAKLAQSGRGVINRNPTKPAAAGTAPPAAPQGAPNANFGPLPPDADNIRRAYESKKSTIVSRASGEDARYLRDLTKEIDALIAAGRLNEAFPKIHQFQIRGFQATSIQMIGPPE